MASQVRQNYHADSEAGINKQINLQLHASYTYLSLAFHFDRDDIALKGSHEFFKNLSHEKRESSRKLMTYQNERGGRIVLQDIMKPAAQEWGSAVESMQAALELEKTVNQSLMDLHKVASDHVDPQMCDWIETHFLTEEVELLKNLGDHITNLKRVGAGLGEFMFDKEALQ